MAKKQEKILKIFCISSIIVTLLVICLLIIIFVTDPFTKPKMKEYYTNDDNFVLVEGEIKEIYNNFVVDIYLITENSNFPITFDGCCNFKIYADEELRDKIFVGDVIKFYSAPKIFFNGYNLPIVYLEKDGIIYLEFEVGKRNLFDNFGITV